MPRKRRAVSMTKATSRRGNGNAAGRTSTSEARTQPTSPPGKATARRSEPLGSMCQGQHRRAEEGISLGITFCCPEEWRGQGCYDDHLIAGSAGWRLRPDAQRAPSLHNPPVAPAATRHKQGQARPARPARLASPTPRSHPAQAEHRPPPRRLLSASCPHLALSAGLLEKGDDPNHQIKGQQQEALQPG